MKGALTYEDIREIQRKERGTSKLQKVEEGFYARLFDYLKSKEKLLEKEGATEEFKQRCRRELSNARKIIKEIILMREQKIATYALQSLKTAEVRRFSMTSQELELFKQLLSSFKRFEESVEKERKKEVKELEEEEIEMPYKVVRVLEDLPAIVGEDLKKYGPAKKGEVMTLPPEVAKILINKKKVKEIKVSFN